MLRPRLGRRLVRTAVVGGAAYAVGSHMAKKSAEQQQQEAYQNQQIEDLQQQQAQQQVAMAPPQPASYTAPQQPMPAMAPPQPQETTPTRDPMEALRQLGELKAAGVLTDQEFDAKKAELLRQI